MTAKVKSARLYQLKATISSGLKSTVDVAEALHEIYEAKLYLEETETFEAFCAKNWDIAKSQAYRLVSFAALRKGLAHSPTGESGLPTNERQTRPLIELADEAERADVWREAVESAPGGRVTGKHVENVVERRRGNDRGALSSSESNEWYTPEEITAAASRVMGGIDLDPASCAEANNIVKARVFFTERDDGLAQRWHGRVWLNPPYGRDDDNKSNQARWSERLIEDYTAKRIEQAHLLVNSATGNAWFQPLWDHPLCFPSSRLKFTPPASADAKKYQPTQSNVIVYFGPHVDRFVEEFAAFGRIVVPRGIYSEVAG